MKFRASWTQTEPRRAQGPRVTPIGWRLFEVAGTAETQGPPRLAITSR